ncbi:hypothetical protein ES705_19563 [subsurface metagenome]
MFLDNKIVALGEYKEGDLRNFSSSEDLERKLTELRGSKHSFPTAKYLVQFRDEAEIGDIIVVYSRKKIFSIDHITSDYFYEQDDLGKDFYPLGIPNRCKVKWILKKQIEDERLATLSKPQFSFYKLDEKHEDIVLKILEENNSLSSGKIERSEVLQEVFLNLKRRID